MRKVDILVETRPFTCWVEQILCRILLSFQMMSSSLLVDSRQIIERARIVSFICCSCPWGVAPGSCTAHAPLHQINCATTVHHHSSCQASSSGTVLTSGPDLSYFGGHICSLHMCTNPRTHTHNPFIPPPSLMHDMI